MVKRLHDIWPSGLQIPPGCPLDAEVCGLALDSRKVRDGDLFFAVPGSQTHGARHVDEALAAGASLILVEASPAADPGRPTDALDQPQSMVPVIEVEALSAHLGLFAAQFYECPAEELRSVAVTGTNGKGCVAWWTAQMLCALGSAAGVCGTLGFGLVGNLQPHSLTTPDPIEVQRILAELLKAGCQTVVIEASSQGLDQGRLDAVPIRIAAFTNLTHDHLDYHGDMESYWQSKKRLFQWSSLEAAVISISDSRGAALAEELCATTGGELRVLRCGFDESAEVRFSSVAVRPDGYQATFELEGRREDLFLAFLGRFSLENLLVSAGILRAAGYTFEDITSALEGLSAPPGRMEAVDVRGRLTIIDYAHTPDALEKALQSLRAHRPAGRVFCVFGCGGGRDQGKRSIMGAVSSRGADQVILTEDMCRGENLDNIIAEIHRGCGDNCKVIPDRKDAVFTALARAEPGDTVLIAGRGHERGPVSRSDRTLLTDRDLVEECLLNWEGG